MSSSIITFDSSLDSLGDVSYDDSLLDFDFDFSDESDFGNNSPLPDVPVLLEESILELLEEMPELLEAPPAIVDLTNSQAIVSTDEEPKINHKPANAGVAKLKKKKSTKNSTVLVKKGVSSNKQLIRAQPPAPLIPPPTMDKGDALVFIPHSFVRFMNIGDISGLSKLLLSHASPTCEFNYKGNDLILSDFLNLAEIFSEIHPDTVNCVHTTKVVGNTVRAKLFSKFTDSHSIFQSVAQSKAQDPLFQRMFGRNMANSTRGCRWKQKVEALEYKTDEEKEQMLTVVNSPGDMVAFANYYMTLTFDDTTRRLTRIDYEFELSSLTLVDTPKTKR